MSATTLGALTFPSRGTDNHSINLLHTLFISLFIYPKPSPIRHHGSPHAKHTAHVLLWSRLATHTLLSSKSFNIHRRIRIQALRSPSSIGLSDYSDEQFEQRNKALFLRSFIISTLKGYGHFPVASPIRAAMWWKGWLWLAAASRRRTHVFST